MHSILEVTPIISLVLDWVSLPSQHTINLTVWAVGMALQCALAVVVFRRSIARRFPCFASLICFFPLRASLLFALASRIDADVYNPLFTTLGYAEMVLQFAVAVELMWWLNRRTEQGGPRQSRIVQSIAAIALAFGFTSLILIFAPSNISLDRIQIFIWIVMIMLFAAALRKSHWRNLLLIAGGFAGFSLIQLATTLGRTAAYVRHEAIWYLGWSYAPGLGYLIVVIFWLVSLRKERL